LQLLGVPARQNATSLQHQSAPISSGDLMITDNTSSLNSLSSQSFIQHLNSRFTDHNDEYVNTSDISSSCNYYELENINNINISNKQRQLHSIMHINIHSLPAKHDQLQLTITRLENNNIEIDVILLCETFLNDSNQKLYNIDGYQLKIVKLIEKAMYIKNNCSHKHIKYCMLVERGDFRQGCTR